MHQSICVRDLSYKELLEIKTCPASLRQHIMGNYLDYCVCVADPTRELKGLI